MRHAAVVLCTGILVTATPQLASAAFCGSLTLDDDAQEVIIGEWGSVSSVAGMPFSPPSYDLGVCWRDVDGSWHLERFTGCDTSTSGGDFFKIQSKGGDDYVATLYQEHTISIGPANPDDFVIAGAYAPEVPFYAMRCDGAAIRPWAEGFDFGIWADLGTGADEFHGSPGDDRGASNYATLSYTYQWPTGWIVYESAPADDAEDMLCGGWGDDELYGDLDDDWTAGAEELIDGGPGVDVCDGDPFSHDGSDSSDVMEGCEGSEDAWLYSGWFDCEDTANPLDVVL